MSKHGRNEKCWCGSDKKYKHCHLARETEDRIKPWELSAAHRKSFSKKLCSAPETHHLPCSGTIVAAHTVPRSISLSQIEEDGHVIAFTPTLEQLIKHNGMLQPSKVGVRKASTFTGFCSAHDDMLFSPIEKSIFTGTQEQCFLLAYRAYAREIYTKRAAADQSRLYKSLDKGRNIEDQIHIQAFAALHAVGIEAAQRDIDVHKARFDLYLTSSNFSSVRAYIIELEQAPTVMCSGTYAPTVDFSGRQLQDMLDIEKTPELMSVSAFYGGTKGYVVFTWMAEDDRCGSAFIKTLEDIPNEELTQKIIEFLFDNFENVFASPKWWRSLNKKTQDGLVHRMIGEIGVAIGILPPEKPKIDIPAWAISKRYRVGC